MVWPIAGLQVGLAVQYGPFCKGHKHGLSQGPLLLLPYREHLPKGSVYCLLHLATVSWLVYRQWQGTMRLDLNNYHKITNFTCPP